MTRSSRHKSHKQSKHSSKEAYSDSDGENLKVKEKERGRDKGGNGSDRGLKDMEAVEKRKLPMQSNDGGKEGQVLSGCRNGVIEEEYSSLKRRKEKEGVSGGRDRWRGSGDERADSRDVEKSLKVKDKGTGESRSRSSKRHESGGETKEDNVAASAVEKVSSKSGSRSDSKRNSEKESREKMRGSEREKKGQESKCDAESYAVDENVSKKQTAKSDDIDEHRQGKRSRNYTGWSVQDDARKTELDKESEKRLKKKVEAGVDGDKDQAEFRDSGERRLSSWDVCAKEGSYRDGKHKEGDYGDKYQENGGKDDSHWEDKHREDTVRNNKRRDDNYCNNGDRDGRRRDDKSREDVDRDSRRREDKCHEDNNRHRNDRHKDGRYHDDKYQEDGERESKRSNEKHRDDGDRDFRCSDDRYNEEPDRDGRLRDEKYREDGVRDNRPKEEKYRDDYERESRHQDGREADELGREKRIREAKYREDRTSRNHSGDISDTKNLKDETHASDLHSRKSSARDDSTYYDDRPRYKDDKLRRKTSDKEDQSDVRSRSNLSSDMEKLSAGTGRVDSVTDRGISSTHVTRDHYRVSKLDESKYRDYAYEERGRHSLTSGRDYAGGVMDKSPSTASTEHKHLGRSDSRRSLDVEESVQKSGGSKDVRDYTNKEGKGSRKGGMETLPGNEFSQADGESFPVSSPFARTNHLRSSSKSLLPPPLRPGVDSLGAPDDDSRDKSNSRYGRGGDPNMGRFQGNTWRGVQNWPSPMANGFMPFQHGPSPVGFPPLMQQFPAPPIFNVRPSMELNHRGIPYHVLDAGRFPSHGRSIGWRNTVDGLCPPPLHGWDANNAVFGEESHTFGRQQWDHSRTLPNGPCLETGGDTWKGSNRAASAELPSAAEKDNCFSHGIDDYLGGQSGPQAQHKKSQTDLQAGSNEPSQPSDAPETKPSPKPIHEDTPITDEKSNTDGALLCRVYLSKLDISSDLTEPELYIQYMGLLDLKDHSVSCDDDDSKILYMEEAAEIEVATPFEIPIKLPFAAPSYSVFQKAMELHKKYKEDSKVIRRGNLTLPSVGNESIPKSDQEELGVAIESSELALAAYVQGEKKLPNFGEEAELPACTQNGVSAAANQKVVAVNVGDKAEELVFPVKCVSMEVQVKSDLEVTDSVSEDVGEPINQSPPKIEDVIKPTVSIGGNAGNSEEIFLIDTKCGPLLLTDVPSEACEATVRVSIESGSVNLSRIHHSPESTH